MIDASFHSPYDTFVVWQYEESRMVNAWVSSRYCNPIDMEINGNIENI